MRGARIAIALAKDTHKIGIHDNILYKPTIQFLSNNDVSQFERGKSIYARTADRNRQTNTFCQDSNKSYDNFDGRTGDRSEESSETSI